MLYFDRVCTVIILGAHTINIENCRIQFEIIKSKKAKENSAKVEIFNLLPKTRKLISEQEGLVKVFAGYNCAEGLIEIGQGDISKVKNNCDKTNVVTEIYMSEGLLKIKNNPLSISFSSNSKVDLEAITRSMQSLTGGQLVFRYVDIDTSKTIDNGYSDMGSIDQILTNLGIQFGFEWSFQNGIVILKGTKKSKAKETLLLTPKNGLILNPETVRHVSRRISKSKIVNQDKNTKSIQSLLQPNLQINDIIAVESKDLTGRYQIEKIIHRGDTHGNDWYSDMEVVSIN